MKERNFNVFNELAQRQSEIGVSFTPES